MASMFAEILVMPCSTSQTAIFGSILTPWKDNSFTINGREETVTVQASRKVFGRRSKFEPRTLHFRDLGE